MILTLVFLNEMWGQQIPQHKICLWINHTDFVCFVIWCPHILFKNWCPTFCLRIRVLNKMWRHQITKQTKSVWFIHKQILCCGICCPHISFKNTSVYVNTWCNILSFLNELWSQNKHLFQSQDDVFDHLHGCSSKHYMFDHLKHKF